MCIFGEKKDIELYKELHTWLSGYTCGGRRTLSEFKYYQKNLWNPIIEKLNELESKENLTAAEMKFLKEIPYSGKMYRKMNYNKRLKGHIVEMDMYCSWSQDISGLQNVKGMGGDILLLISNVEKGINIQSLLEYFLYTKVREQFMTTIEYNLKSLERYYIEKEIVAPIIFNEMIDIKIVDMSDLNQWNLYPSLDKSKWSRSKI